VIAPVKAADAQRGWDARRGCVQLLVRAGNGHNWTYPLFCSPHPSHATIRDVVYQSARNCTSGPWHVGSARDTMSLSTSDPLASPPFHGIFLTSSARMLPDPAPIIPMCGIPQMIGSSFRFPRQESIDTSLLVPLPHRTQRT
jgi:hypothetical protein